MLELSSVGGAGEGPGSERSSDLPASAPPFGAASDVHGANHAHAGWTAGPAASRDADAPERSENLRTAIGRARGRDFSRAYRGHRSAFRLEISGGVKTEGGA